MNKTQLIEKISKDADLSKVDAGKALDSIVNAVTNTLKHGEEVALPGFGTFKTSHRAARNGRNPQTGETIQIAASTVATWKPGKGLKDAVNS